MDPSENTVADGNVQLDIGQKEMGILAIPISTVNSCHLAAKIERSILRSSNSTDFFLDQAFRQIRNHLPGDSLQHRGS